MSARHRHLAVVAPLAVLGLLLAASPALSRADRSGPPEPGPVRPLRLPRIERHTLPNGVPVLLVGMHEVPIAEVVLVLPAGATADPEGREGLAHMTAAMLDEGAAGRDALALADAVDFLGAELASEASWDGATVRLRVPVARLEPALALMADVALRPDFPEAELERLRADALTSLLQDRAVPGAIAARALARAVFGTDHRYGRPQTGDAASLAALTVGALRGFHAARYTPTGAALVVVGDVTEAVLPALEAVFGAWAGPGSKAPETEVVSPPQVKGRAVWLVDKPGAPQSAIRVGRVGPSWHAPLYHAEEVMNTLLGGLFTSRLNDNLREQHGYTYGAFSALLRLRSGGLFVARSDVQADKTAPALAEFMAELRRIRTPALAEEVERARTYDALGYARGFETTAQMAERVVDKVLYALPDGFFETYVPKALAVDAPALEEAAREIVDPESLSVVVVGDRATIEAPVRALKLGEVKTLTVEDVMGPAPKLD